MYIFIFRMNFVLATLVTKDIHVLQGLTHLGKGTLTLCPYHSDRQLMSQVAVAGLLTVLVSFLDVRNSKLSFFFFFFPFWPSYHLLIFISFGRHCISLCLYFTFLFIFSFSYFGKVSLRTLRFSSCNAATNACHIWWGVAAFTSICSSGSSK